MLLRMFDTARVFIRLASESWRAPVGSARWDGSGDPILLLHGFGGTPRMLHPLARFLSRTLERPTLDVALGIGLGDIRDSAIEVHRLLEEQRVSRCDVVGYSMGGLVAAYLAKCLDQGRRIRRVVTLGTPFGGVPLASRWPAAFSRWCRATAQMRGGSPFLEELVRQCAPRGTRMVSIAGAQDTLVPPSAARLEGSGCRNLLVPGVDHFRLLTSRRVFRCVAELLEPAAGSHAAKRASTAATRHLRRDVEREYGLAASVSL